MTAEETATEAVFYRLTGVDYPESGCVPRRTNPIQDLSSSLAGDAAGIKRVILYSRVCGAPGGKRGFAADLLHGTGQVEIRDVSDYKGIFDQGEYCPQRLYKHLCLRLECV